MTPTTHPMRIAFHNGRGERLWWVSLSIKLWPFAGIGRFSHVELVFPADVVGEKNSFSSSGEDGGVRWKNIDYKKHPDRWAFIDFSVTPDQLNHIKSLCDVEVGKKYDFLGILGFFLLGTQELIQNKKKWWCSEIVEWVLDIRPFRNSPNIFYRRFRNGFTYWPIK